MKECSLPSSGRLSRFIGAALSQPGHHNVVLLVSHRCFVQPLQHPGNSTPAYRMQGEVVWRLILASKPWEQPDQQLLCRLLCTSAAMAQLVHELCVGKAAVKLGRRPVYFGLEMGVPFLTTPEQQQQEGQRQVAAAGAVFRRWLAKHARLLYQLQLDLWDEQQHDVAAGLCAAAGMVLADAPERSIIMQDIPAAATGNASEAQVQAGLAVQEALPLASLQLYSCDSQGSCGCPLLHALRACRHLTQLRLLVKDVYEDDLLQSGMAALQDLQDLSLSLRAHWGPGISAADLRCGLQLTRLHLHGIDAWGDALRMLPASLRALEHRPTGKQLGIGDAAHLTALTRLHCCDVKPKSRLPPSLWQLEVERVLDVQPLLGLTQLQHLHLGYLDHPWQLQKLASCIGLSLTSVVLKEATEDVANMLLSKRFDNNLPLIELCVTAGDSLEDHVIDSVAHMGQWHGLQVLKLESDVEVQDTPQQFAAQLQQLTCLTCLYLTADVGGSHDEPVLQPVVDSIVGLSSLRDLWLGLQKLTAEQSLQLKALTNLRTLCI